MADSRNPQKHDDESHTQRHAVGSQHGAIETQNEDFFRNPPNNLGLDRAADQDRASDLIGARGTEPIADAPSEAELRRVQELADRLNK
ncbi:hypothetical protein JCM10450v2_000065 [Rhodotorula kratochvilovae]